MGLPSGAFVPLPANSENFVVPHHGITLVLGSPSQGRWISPDPLGVGAVDITTPQSWNRYAYVLNNPLIFTDPLGLQLGYCQWDDGSSDDETDSSGDSDTGDFGESSCDAGGGTWVNDVDVVSITVNGGNGGDGGTIENGQPIFPQIIAANNGNVSCNSTTGICVPSTMMKPRPAGWAQLSRRVQSPLGLTLLGLFQRLETWFRRLPLVLGQLTASWHMAVLPMG